MYLDMEALEADLAGVLELHKLQILYYSTRGL